MLHTIIVNSIFDDLYFVSQVMSILKYLYPVPREDSKRILTFANHDDYISFRHHTYKKVKLN